MSETITQTETGYPEPPPMWTYTPRLILNVATGHCFQKFETTNGNHRIVFSRGAGDYVLMAEMDSEQGATTAFALLWARIKNGKPFVEVEL